MDGFDDLLAPSRDPLENPFEDPFAKPRSSSPDPWASFGATAVPSFSEEQPWGSSSPTVLTHTHDAFAHTGGFHDLEPEQQEPIPAPASEEEVHEEASPPDPLDTAAFNAAEAAAEAEEAAAAAAAAAAGEVVGDFGRSTEPYVCVHEGGGWKEREGREESEAAVEGPARESERGP